mgnify:CR=1 FL=1
MYININRCASPLPTLPPRPSSHPPPPSPLSTPCLLWVFALVAIWHFTLLWWVLLDKGFTSVQNKSEFLGKSSINIELYQSFSNWSEALVKTFLGETIQQISQSLRYISRREECTEVWGSRHITYPHYYVGCSVLSQQSWFWALFSPFLPPRQEEEIDISSSDPHTPQFGVIPPTPPTARPGHKAKVWERGRGREGEWNGTKYLTAGEEDIACSNMSLIRVRYYLSKYIIYNEIFFYMYYII